MPEPSLDRPRADSGFTVKSRECLSKFVKSPFAADWMRRTRSCGLQLSSPRLPWFANTLLAVQSGPERDLLEDAKKVSIRFAVWPREHQQRFTLAFPPG